MEIINATWEKRNLGITCEELILSDEDGSAALGNGLNQLQAEYRIVKVPAGKFALYTELAGKGFSFAENLFTLKRELKNTESDSRQMKALAAFEYSEITEEKKRINLLERIERDKIFRTDRIALDPFFGEEASGRRYRLWAEDLLRSDAKLLSVTTDNKDIGFSVLDHCSERVTDQALVGLFPEFRGKGLGCCAIMAAVMESKKLGAEYIQTRVSSNNIPSLKTHLKAGYSIQDSVSVFVKHIIF